MGPKDTMGEILNVGFSFFVIIILASYTANLASNLITQRIESAPVTSIDDADSRGLPICVLAGTVAQSVLQSTYMKLKIIPIHVGVLIFRSIACIDLLFFIVHS